MVRSMTGYGRACELIDGTNITVELKSVNSRYLEFSSRVYKNYSFLEDKLKTYVRQLISRGKVECNVQIDALETDDVIVQLNESLAAGYINAVNTLCEKYGLENDFTVSRLAAHNDIFAIRKAPADEEKIWNAVQQVLLKATENFVVMREAEGEKLRDDVLSRADLIISLVEKVEARSPETVKEYSGYEYNITTTGDVASTGIENISQDIAITWNSNVLSIDNFNSYYVEAKGKGMVVDNGNGTTTMRIDAMPYSNILITFYKKDATYDFSLLGSKQAFTELVDAVIVEN